LEPAEVNRTLAPIKLRKILAPIGIPAAGLAWARTENLCRRMVRFERPSANEDRLIDGFLGGFASEFLKRP
jgi:hypothetical protein